MEDEALALREENSELKAELRTLEVLLDQWREGSNER